MTAEMQTQTVVLSRRSFLISTGAASVAVAFGSLPKDAFAATKTFTPNAWVVVGTDGIVTIMSAPAELGQGTMTALPAVVADDMDADWRKVRVIQSPADAEIYGNPAIFGQLRTLGSRSVMGYYGKLRLIGAQTRKVLLANAAETWKVPVAELTTEPGVVVHKKSGRKLGYGTLAKTAKIPDPLPQATKDDLKPLSQCRYIGHDLARVDVPLKVSGKAKYGIDVELPHMLYGALLRAPVEHEAPEHIDDSAAKAVKGIVKVVPLPKGVGIIGDTVEGTQKAKALLKVTWTKTAKARSYDSDKIVEDYRGVARDLNQKGVPMVAQGDAAAALAGAAKVVSADFFSDHVAHAQLEPLNATALVKDGTVEVWLSNQSPSATIMACTAAAGTTPDKVKVHSMLTGGAFGRTSDDADHAFYAVLLAKAVPGRPVKMIWSRPDDLQNDIYRPITAQHVNVGLDASGNIVAWRQRIVSPSHFGRLSEKLLEKLGGKDVVAAGSGDFRYPVPAHLVEYVRAERGFDIGPWRATAAGYTKFAIETMIDELAAMKGTDPVAFRLALLKSDPRAVKIIETVAKMSRWDKKRSAGRALGIGYSDALNSYTAVVAEVSLNEKTGDIKVHEIWAAIDPGVAVQPRNTAYQLEGGIVMGMSAALFEQINVQNGEVQESNFGEYSVVRMADVPPIAVKVISTDNHPTGVGEAGISPVAPAIANAVARLTGGKRLRHLPMLPERVKAVLKA